jgi:hypothetical protein
MFPAVFIVKQANLNDNMGITYYAIFGQPI